MANEGPSLTKATYDKKRTRAPAPSPERRKAAEVVSAIAAEKERSFRQRMNADPTAVIRELFGSTEEYLTKKNP